MFLCSVSIWVFFIYFLIFLFHHGTIRISFAKSHENGVWLVRSEMILEQTYGFDNQFSYCLYVFHSAWCCFVGRLRLTHCAVFLPGFEAGGAWDRLNGGSQRAEEAGDERQAQATPGAEHGPAVTVADVVWEAVQVARIAGKLKIDSCYTGAQRDDAERAWEKKKIKRVLYWQCNAL